MKRFIFLILLLFCGVVYADTINLHWLNEDGTTYEDSTCTIDGDLILPTQPTKYGHTFTGWKVPDYILIEYLESTGTQWIDTGFVPLQNYLRVTGKIQYDNFFNTGESFALFFGSFDGGRVSMTLYVDTTTNTFSNAGIEIGSSFGTRISAGQVHTYTDYEFDLEAKNGYLNGYFNNIEYKNVEYSGQVNNGRSIRLFASVNVYGNAYAFVSGKCYGFKIYDTTGLVRDMIPVLDQHKVPCMYDRVSEQFFYNAGTGQFIAGPVVQ